MPPYISNRHKSTFLIGSEDINVMTAIRSFGKTNWPLGLLISEQTWRKEQIQKSYHLNYTKLRLR